MTSPIPSPSPILSPSVRAGRWPKGQYVIDMDRKFKEIDKLLGMSLQECFEMVFQEPFVPTTYHDQCQRWTKATDQQRHTALAAGRTPAGHWEVFAQGVPLK
ncbi:hypothetical protein L208DRAFT_1308463 [Tricholoma matsutake]|nr:hypothetical protein L208DRAFT_1308463 [Tricholoma matsutake 945]